MDDPAEPGADPVPPRILFTSEGLERGLTEPVVSQEEVSGDQGEGGTAAVVAQDLDADGDIDLLIGHLGLGPSIHENTGDGHFVDHGRPWDLSVQTQWDWLPAPAAAVRSIGVAATDLDGDGLPEVLNSSFGVVVAFQNLGGLQFGAPVVLYEDPSPGRLFRVHPGDVDGDGRLDLLIPSQLVDGDDLAPQALHDLLLGDADGGFTLSHQLRVEPVGSDAQTGILSDVDGDALPDALIFMDQGQRSGAFTHRTGGGSLELEDRAAALGLDPYMNVMGVDAADLNGDGRPDLVVTVLGPPLVFLSDDDSFIESGPALGIAPAASVGEWATVGWSLSLADLDNDCDLEIIQSSGRAYGTTRGYHDLLWSPEASGQYTDVTVAAGLGSEVDHYGVAAADLTGDGCVDLVFAGPGEPPELLVGHCGDGHWIEVDLAGPPGNAEGYGALIEIASPCGPGAREILSVRAGSQDPSLVHAGLGADADPVDIRVRWPGGEAHVARSVAVDQRIQLRHPDTLVPPAASSALLSTP